MLSQLRGYARWGFLILLILCSRPGLAEDSAIQLLRTAAEGGIADAQYELAKRLEMGDGMNKDQAEARRWYEKAAKGGSTDAQAWVARKAEAERAAAAAQAAIAAKTAIAAAQAKAEADARAKRDAKLQRILGTMVTIPAGIFRMGGDSGDESPTHTVHVKAFRLMANEVTFAQYENYASATGRELPDDKGWGRGNRPVINVSWDDAVAYAQWASKETGKRVRLPTEAEWEYAARAGTTTAYWWGNNVGSGKANCDGCGSQWDNRQTAPVGSFAANPWELYDTAGNVWEWVQDCYYENYAGAPTDGSAWEDGKCESRVVRGGSWSLKGVYLRSAHREWFTPSNRLYYQGFRLAQDL